MPYRMHLSILAGIVHCLLVQVLYCAKWDALTHPSWYGTLCLGTGATVPYRIHLCILAGMIHCVLIQVLLRDIG